MNKIIFCERCKKEIKKGTKAACMNTFNEFPEVSDERYFHFKCFIEWRDEKIMAAGESAGKKAMKNIIPMIKPVITNAIENAKKYSEETEEGNLQEFRIS